MTLLGLWPIRDRQPGTNGDHARLRPLCLWPVRAKPWLVHLVSIWSSINDVATSEYAQYPRARAPRVPHFARDTVLAQK